MIVAHGLSKRFGNRLALQNIDLQVKAGEIVALLGPNGAGKSTLLRILATLARPSFGQLELAGCRLPDEAAAARASLGYVGHQPVLYDDLSAEQNLAFFAQLYGVSKPKRRINELLDLVDLQSRRREPVRTFSRGMQQRLALARALLHRPKILLLDEPHSGLDRGAAATLDKTLRSTARGGAAILIATHDLTRVLGLAHRVEVLDAGRLVASLGKRQLTAQQLPRLYDRALRSPRAA
jgi:heme exporter protein A